jgi:hypothetical protein
MTNISIDSLIIPQHLYKWKGNKMKSILKQFYQFVCVLFFLIFLITTLSAQEPDTLFYRTDMEGRCILETTDSNYIAVCCTEGDIRIFKVSKTGDSLWSKVYGGPDYEDVESVRQTADKGFIIIGTTSSYGAGQEDVWLIKTDSKGDTIWTRTFGGDSNDIGENIQVTDDGGFIIIGTTASYGLGGNDIWLIKTDSIGTIQWSKTFGDESDDEGFGVLQTNDTGYILGGNSSSLGGVWLIKTNSEGDTSWTKTFNLPGISEEQGECIIEATNGFLICGNDWDNGFLIKTDNYGDTLWSKTRDSEHHTVLYPDIYKTLEGNYFLGANLISHEGMPRPGRYGVVSMIDDNGNYLWDRELEKIATISSVIQTSDGAYLALGWEGLTKLVQTSSAIETTGYNITEEFNLYKNYPNPFNPSTTIEFDLPKSSNVKIEVYNIAGQKIQTLLNKKMSAGSHKVDFNAENLSSGVYFYKIEAGEFQDVKKMILLR